MEILCRAHGIGNSRSSCDCNSRFSFLVSISFEQPGARILEYSPGIPMTNAIKEQLAIVYEPSDWTAIIKVVEIVIIKTFHLESTSIISNYDFSRALKSRLL